MVQKALLRALAPFKLADKHNDGSVFRLIDVFRSLKLQFVLLVSVIVIGCAFLAVWIDTRAELQKNHALRMSQANVFSQLLARSTSTHLENYTIHDLSELLDEVSERPNINYIAVTSTLIEDLKLAHFKPASEALVEKLLADNAIQFIPSATLTEGAYHVVIPVLVDEKRAGAIYIGWHMEGRWQLLPSILKRELLTTLPMFLIIILLVIFMIKRVIQPLDELKLASERIAEGDLDIKIKHSRFREISSLSHTFMNMAGQLSDSINRIKSLAYKDSLTGLSNRTLFNRHMEAAHFQQQNAGTKFAVCFLDIDDFSRVNDTLGHDAGDYLLAEVANRLNKVVCDLNRSENKKSACGYHDEITNGAILSRFGGDEFTLLLQDIKRTSDIELIVEAMICAMHEPIWVNDHSITVGLSCGVAICPQDGETLCDILRAADLAMYHAKRQPGVSYRFFAECMDKRAQTRMVLEADLRKALKTNALSLVFQPKVCLNSRRVVGAEALVRWQHPDRGMIMPSEFIPIAEESRLINELGLWVLKRSIAAAAHWYGRGYKVPIAVNVSAVQLEDANFVEEVRAALVGAQLPPSMLELEITETVALSDPDASAAQIAPLQEDGVRFAIDDFGTGYSNLSQLRCASFDVFKIDRSFTSTMCHEQDSKVIVETIIAMAKAMNYSTVAEGVESEEEARMLYEAGCNVGQGYLFAKPMPLARLINHFKNDIASNKPVVSLKTVRTSKGGKRVSA
ncbi:MAG: EAL domain-containing protein [Hyphomicrobiales bacterium]